MDKNKVTIREEFNRLNKMERRKNVTMQWSPLVALILLVLGFSIIAPGFRTSYNMINLLNQLSVLLPIAVGLTFIIMLGSINLAVEGTVAMCGSIFSTLVINNRTDSDLGFWAILIIIAIGTLSGLLIGLIHVKLKLPSFMTTFAFNYIGLGVALLSYGGFAPMVTDPYFVALNTACYLKIPILTWIGIALFIVFFLIERVTPFGVHVLAIGANENTLKSIGVKINRLKVTVFALSGFCFAVAGFISVVRLGRGDVMLGKGTLFPAITAVVAGGTALSGGKGGLLNTLVGVLIIAVLQNGLIMMNVNPYIQSGILGVIIVVAVAFTVIRDRKQIVK